MMAVARATIRGVNQAPPHRFYGRGHGPRRSPLSTAQGTRGPYRLKNAKTSYEERLARRQEPRPACKCGCEQLVEWDTRRCRWYRYVAGHYRPVVAYHDPAWLREQYVERRRTTHEIAAECGVGHGAVLKAMRKQGIPRRSHSESRVGRHLGEQNAAWKGGVADWDYAAGWKAIARKIRDRDEWTCQGCGEQRKRWGHSLHVHHIDGDKLNNDPQNLISLCAGCHARTHREEVMPV